MDKTGAADSPAAPASSASVVASDDDPTQEVDGLECDDLPSGTKPTETANETQWHGCLESVGRQEIEPLQAGMSCDIPAATAVVEIETPADVQAVEEAIPQEWSELRDLLSRLQQSLAGGSADALALIRPAARAVELYRLSADSAAASRVSRILADWQSRIGAALTAVVPEPLAADAMPTLAPALGGTEEGQGSALTGPEAAAVRPTGVFAEILPAVQRLLAQLPKQAPALQQNAANIVLREEAPAAPAGATAGLPPVAAAADVTAAHASPLRASAQPEGVRNGAAPESSRLAGTDSDSGASVPETRHEESADSDVFQQPTDDSRFSKMPAPGTLTANAGEDQAEGHAVSARAARLSTAVEGGAEKTADSPSVARDKEPHAGVGRTGIFDQIVQRAAVQLKNDQGEINIDLKPDFLGRVRMQILTENQQVTVRIVTELATVRDMLETGLNQLKSELQNQGLQVERLEVAVADDQRKRGWQQANSAPARKTAGGGAVAAMESSEIEERSASIYYRQRSRGAAGIDMFV
jgi:flagellar hook-length control protein FliK